MCQKHVHVQKKKKKKRKTVLGCPGVGSLVRTVNRVLLLLHVQVHVHVHVACETCPRARRILAGFGVLSDTRRPTRPAILL
eukprot:3063566-Prymnesium_polylepis.1